MNVLSLFDGISCGRVALDELGIPVEHYYASEIDKYAIAVTQRNYPDTIQLGDIENWREWDIDWSSIDLVQGGSPCQGFSFAGKQLNFDDPRSRLFFVFAEILDYVRKHNPDVKFLLENVRMKQEHQDVITERIGVSPVKINSALVSAQNRIRLYWTNIAEIQQPEDLLIFLKDVLEDDATEPMYSNIYGGFKEKKPRVHTGKSVTIRTASGGGHIPSVTLKRAVQQKPRGKNKGGIHTEKSPTLTANSFEHNHHVVREKSKCVRSSGRGSYDRHEWDSVGNKGTELFWRKLTPVECERLQTLPDGYTEGISNTQRYKALGNGWNVSTIKHIYKDL